ncbi:kinase-like domain-containing protein [Ganoderma leucocontextum]|nr:kinase-like domain-containing protein [Ganoderma leucocontextum]
MAARSEDVGRVFALKKTSVTNHVRHPMLLHEACALVLLRGQSGFPRSIAWGRSQYFEYLVMEHLGRSLKDTIDTIGATRLTLRNLVILICQMLDITEHLHEKGIIHCDLKPHNFLFGLGQNAGRLHLVDFGLARPWIDPKIGKPFPEESNFGFRGTPPFASRHAHQGHTPSRRDDMESVAYILVNLLTGTLPWTDTKSDDKLLPILYAHSGRTLCQGYDDVFAQFVDYARSLDYEDTPKYRHW